MISTFANMIKQLRKPWVVIATVFILGLFFDRIVLGGADFDQLHRVVLSRVVNTGDDLLTAVTLVDNDLDLSERKVLLPLPDSLQARLRILWAERGLDGERIISANRVQAVYGDVERFGMKMKSFEQYVDAETGKGVRVYSIDSIRWLGSSEALVRWSGIHASLDGVGSTIRLKKRLGFWRVVDEGVKWHS